MLKSNIIVHCLYDFLYFFVFCCFFALAKFKAVTLNRRLVKVRERWWCGNVDKIIFNKESFVAVSFNGFYQRHVIIIIVMSLFRFVLRFVYWFESQHQMAKRCEWRKRGTNWDWSDCRTHCFRLSIATSESVYIATDFSMSASLLLLPSMSFVSSADTFSTRCDWAINTHGTSQYFIDCRVCVTDFFPCWLKSQTNQIAIASRYNSIRLVFWQYNFSRFFFCHTKVKIAIFWRFSFDCLSARTFESSTRCQDNAQFNRFMTTIFFPFVDFQFREIYVWGDCRYRQTFIFLS